MDLIFSIAKREVTFERDRVDQLLVEHVIARHVRNDDAQHVVDVSRHPVEFHHLWHGADRRGETLQPGFGVIE